jgi:hypothetical protein
MAADMLLINQCRLEKKHYTAALLQESFPLNIRKKFTV